MTTYNVVAVGPPGSGKTVFLAALHNALASGRLARGLVPSVDLRSAAWLHSAYQQVADPSKTWPAGTDAGQPMREVVIGFAVQRTRQPFLFGKPRLVQYPAFTVTYVDYAGEWLINGHEQDPDLMAQFESRLTEAHVVLCFLDGHRLLKLLRGSGGKAQRTLDEFRFTMQRCRGNAERRQAPPVIIVLTKWDLVEKQYTLDDVRKVLKNSGLTELADAHGTQHRLTRRPQGGIWLVPVTATGSNFAHEASGGIVEKTGYEAPEPRNILLPLSLGIVDISEMALDQYRKANTATPGWVGALKKLVLGGAETVPGTLDGTVIDPDLRGLVFDLRKLIAFTGDLSVGAVQLLSWPARVIVQLARGQVRRIRARGLDGVSSQEGALMYVALAFQAKRQEHTGPGYQARPLWSDGDRLKFL